MVFDDLLDVLEPDLPVPLAAAEPDAEADADAEALPELLPDAEAAAEAEAEAEEPPVALAGAEFVAVGLFSCRRATAAASNFAPSGHGQAADRDVNNRRSASMLVTRPLAFILVQGPWQTRELGTLQLKRIIDRQGVGKLEGRGREKQFLCECLLRMNKHR